MLQLLTDLIFHLVFKWTGFRKHHCTAAKGLFQLKHLSDFSTDFLNFMQKNSLTHFLNIFTFQRVLWYRSLSDINDGLMHTQKNYISKAHRPLYKVVFNPFLLGQSCKWSNIFCKRHSALVAVKPKFQQKPKDLIYLSTSYLITIVEDCLWTAVRSSDRSVLFNEPHAKRCHSK